MKKFNYLLVVFLPLMLLSGSCSKEASPTPDFSIKNASGLIAQYNVEKLPHHQGEYLQGSVYMRAASNGVMVVFVSNEDFGGSTLIYQIQTPGLENSNFKASLDKAQILFTRNNLVINATNKKQNYLLSLAPEQDIVNLDSYNSIVKGYGLSRYMMETQSLTSTERTADFGDPGDPPPPEACYCNANGTTSECESGGTGSTSCSGAYGPNGTDCTVTCGDGYYSCCSSE